MNNNAFDPDKLPNDFDINIYKNLNPDLNYLDDNKTVIHFLSTGIKEERLYKKPNDFPNDFDAMEYKFLNPDLQHLDDNKALIHFLSTGIKEERLYKKPNNLPNDFDAMEYKFLNPDLQHLDDNKALIHFLSTGIKEERLYKKPNNLPNDFDAKIYKLLNPDLQHIEDDKIYLHFILYGIAQNRQYKKQEQFKEQQKNKKQKNNSPVYINKNFEPNTHEKTIYNKRQFTYFLPQKNVYTNFNIYENKNVDLKHKNNILLLSSTDISNNFELIFNVNYTIVSPDEISYKYAKKMDNFFDTNEQFGYIIWEKNYESNVINLIIRQNSINLNIFLNKKITLLQVCLPNFNNHPQRLIDHYNSWNNDKIWIVRFDEYLCKKFIDVNFNKYVQICYKLIYSLTPKCDLLRCCFLYKHGGMYMDLSVKLINNDFIDHIQKYDFVSTRDEYHDSLQAGIMYIKNQKSIVYEMFLTEIVTGTLNETLNVCEKKSQIFQKIPTNDCFFYGPMTLFSIYDAIKSELNSYLFNTMISSSVNDGKSTVEFLSFTKNLKTNIDYLQVKYIGYYSDIESINGNKKHYSKNWHNGLNYNSPLELINKIMVINLLHRTDRYNQIEAELSKHTLSNNKIEFVEGIYDANNGAIGCAKSHIKCIEKAILNNYESILILEDDFIFPNDLHTFDKHLLDFMVNNDSWDVILLTFSEFGPPINISTNVEHVYRNLWSNSAAAYIVKNTIYNDLIKYYSVFIETQKCPIDVIWNSLKISYNWYVIEGTLGSQRESYSDIEKQDVFYQSDYNKILY
jgi:glycosyl transferase family 25